MARVRTPSSATPCNTDPAGALKVVAGGG
jgi:hypothetical protein